MLIHHQVDIITPPCPPPKPSPDDPLSTTKQPKEKKRHGAKHIKQARRKHVHTPFCFLSAPKINHTIPLSRAPGQLSKSLAKPVTQKLNGGKKPRKEGENRERTEQKLHKTSVSQKATKKSPARPRAAQDD